MLLCMINILTPMLISVKLSAGEVRNTLFFAVRFALFCGGLGLLFTDTAILGLHGLYFRFPIPVSCDSVPVPAFLQ